MRIRLPAINLQASHLGWSDLGRLLMRLVHGHHGRVAGIVEHFAATAHERIRRFGLEGMVEVADRPYRAGRSKDWLKVKNRKHPAYRRVQDQF